MAKFNGKNSLGARDIYLSRAVYNSHVLTNLLEVKEPTVETKQIKDFIKDERMLIGRINLHRHAIYPRTRFLKSFSSNPKHLALNFVVDAFEAMKKEYDRLLKTNQLDPATKALSELSIAKAYSSSIQNYDEHLKALQNAFMGFIKRKNRLDQISDFDSFIPFYMDFMKRSAADFPFTKSMYFLTRHISPLTSGMIIETHAGSYGDDEEKVQLFYKQRNFEQFKNLAYSHGFMIDKHVPWRLVADLNSPNMVPYIRAALGTKNSSAATVLEVMFKTPHSDDIPSIIRMMLKLYNAIAIHRPRTRIYSPAATVSPYSSKTSLSVCKGIKIIRRHPLNIETLARNYETGFWLDLYTRTRNVESGLHYKEETIQNIVNNSIDLGKKLDRSAALRYIITKFDNVEQFEGSLFHDITKMDMAEDPLATGQSVDETVQRSVQASNFIVY